MRTALTAAMFVLFGGNQDLDNWITLSGKWVAHDGALVCETAPARIRSSFESDHFTLTFQYRHADRGINHLYIRSKLNGGGREFLLLSHGLSWSNDDAAKASVPSDQWIGVNIEVGSRVHASYHRETGELLGELNAGDEPGTRGFIAFEATEPGLEIRNISVTEPKFTMLFEGKTLKGWEPVGRWDPAKPNWVAENGVLRCTHRGGSWLRTLETYHDFVLRLEYQLPTGGNSGIYLRAPLEGRVSQIGLEIQLLDEKGWGGKVKGSQRNGSVYSGIAPEVEVPAPPDQWNAVEVLCQGKRIRTTLNGVQLYDARLDDREKDEQLLHHPLATRRLEGFIGLQDHSGAPKFRNIRVQPLPRTAATQPSLSRAPATRPGG